jgi:hypothetical protein
MLDCRAEQEQGGAGDELAQQFEMQGLHIISVLEQVGDDVMRENFWNYGQFRCFVFCQSFTNLIVIPFMESGNVGVAVVWPMAAL